MEAYKEARKFLNRYTSDSFSKASTGVALPTRLGNAFGYGKLLDEEVDSLTLLIESRYE